VTKTATTITIALAANTALRCGRLIKRAAVRLLVHRPRSKKDDPYLSIVKDDQKGRTSLKASCLLRPPCLMGSVDQVCQYPGKKHREQHRSRHGVEAKTQSQEFGGLGPDGAGHGGS